MPSEKSDVVLVAMPWSLLCFPSIQLGILSRVLEGAGLSVGTRSYFLELMELLAETELAGGEVITVADYDSVSDRPTGSGLGDWIFCVPPYKEVCPEDDARYFDWLRSVDVSEDRIRKARVMREVVPRFLDRCLEDLLAAEPRVVGFTTTFSQNVPSLVLAKMLKAARPDVQIVFGGANCDGSMGAALHRSFPWVDVVVRGEGERVAPAVIGQLLAGEPVTPHPGLCYRSDEGTSIAVPESGGTVSMNDVPAPDYDEFFARFGRSQFGHLLADELRLPYETSRGCWWGAKQHCTFCGLNGTSMQFRSKSPDIVYDDLVGLSRRYEHLDFFCADNIMDLAYLEKLTPRMDASGFDLRMFFETKANLSRVQLETMRAAGIDHVQPGIESLSTPILKLMNKGVTALQNIRLLKWASEYGIEIAWNVIYGFPGEDPAEYERMADLAASLVHLQPPATSRLRVMRFSPYHDRPGDYGLTVTGAVESYQHLYPVDRDTLDDLAYHFNADYDDGRDPESYVGELKAALADWRDGYAENRGALRYRRGPGFVTILDSRTTVQNTRYTLSEVEAAIFLLCDDGRTARWIRRRLRAGGAIDVAEETITGFLDQLVEARLVYREGDKYLSLAVPADPQRRHYRRQAKADPERAKRGRVPALRVLAGGQMERAL